MNEKKLDLSEIAALIGSERLKGMVNRVAKHLQTGSQTTHNALAKAFGYQTWQALTSCLEELEAPAAPVVVKASGPNPDGLPGFYPGETAAEINLCGFSGADIAVIGAVNSRGEKWLDKSPAGATLTVRFPKAFIDIAPTFENASESIDAQGDEFVITYRRKDQSEATPATKGLDLLIAGLIKRDGVNLSLDISTLENDAVRKRLLNEASQLFANDATAAQLAITFNEARIDYPQYWASITADGNLPLLSCDGWEYLLADLPVTEGYCLEFIDSVRREIHNEALQTVIFTKKMPCAETAATELIRRDGANISLDITRVAASATCKDLLRTASLLFSKNAELTQLAITGNESQIDNPDNWACITSDGTTQLLSNNGWEYLLGDLVAPGGYSLEFISSTILAEITDKLRRVTFTKAAPTQEKRALLADHCLVIKGETVCLNVTRSDLTAPTVKIATELAAERFLKNSCIKVLEITAPAVFFESYPSWPALSSDQAPEGLLSAVCWEHLLLDNEVPCDHLDFNLAGAALYKNNNGPWRLAIIKNNAEDYTVSNSKQSDGTYCQIRHKNDPPRLEEYSAGPQATECANPAEILFPCDAGLQKRLVQDGTTCRIELRGLNFRGDATTIKLLVGFGCDWLLKNEKGKELQVLVDPDTAGSIDSLWPLFTDSKGERFATNNGWEYMLADLELPEQHRHESIKSGSYNETKELLTFGR